MQNGKEQIRKKTFVPHWHRFPTLAQVPVDLKCSGRWFPRCDTCSELF